MPNDENGLLNYRYPFCDVFMMSAERKGIVCSLLVRRLY